MTQVSQTTITGLLVRATEGGTGVASPLGFFQRRGMAFLLKKG